MTEDRLAKLTKVCNDIAEDAANDAKIFDGKPFTGRTVAEYFGNQGAAIAALANLCKEALEECRRLTKEREDFQNSLESIL